MVLPEAQVGHRTPQRLRLKIPSKKKEAAYFLTFGEEFARTHFQGKMTASWTQ